MDALRQLQNRFRINSLLAQERNIAFHQPQPRRNRGRNIASAPVDIHFCLLPAGIVKTALLPALRHPAGVENLLPRIVQARPEKVDVFFPRLAGNAPPVAGTPFEDTSRFIPDLQQQRRLEHLPRAVDLHGDRVASGPQELFHIADIVKLVIHLTLDRPVFHKRPVDPDTIPRRPGQRHLRFFRNFSQLEFVPEEVMRVPLPLLHLRF